MKITIQTGYRADLADLAEGLNDLMADLEDIRDEAQDALDETGNEEIQKDVRRMDEALQLMNRAADLLDGEDA